MVSNSQKGLLTDDHLLEREAPEWWGGSGRGDEVTEKTRTVST